MRNLFGLCNRISERWCGSLIFTYLCGANIVDFTVDSINEVPPLHLIIEAIVSLIGFFIVYRMIAENIQSRAETATFKKLLASRTDEISSMKSETEKWRQETSRLLSGLATAIEHKFNDWQLTPAERDIGFFLLKGLSLKNIADVRGVSERTVRQQTLTIYEKSGLAGRAELSAFFLKDLLPSTSTLL